MCEGRERVYEGREEVVRRGDRWRGRERGSVSEGREEVVRRGDR